MGTDAINPEVIKKRMWLDYQYACSNPANEALNSIHTLITDLADPNLDFHSFLQKAADMIHGQLSITEVTIGLKSLQDGLYRYEVMAGLSDESWEAHRKLVYKLEDFLSSETYKHKQISKYTRLFLAEDNPYGAGEDATYKRDLMMQMKRHSLEDTIEGDYLDILIMGKDDELLGWIEISGLENGKFPDVQTLKSVELLASIIGVALAHPHFRGA
jgi:hypothetical protein